MKEKRKKFRFAIMGAGNITKKFCEAVKLLEDCTVVAIASKSMERAAVSAEKNNVKHAYDSYEKMLVEEKPDGVYIAVTTDAHYALTMLCLNYQVPVLCEKAMFTSHAQAEEVFRISCEKKIFVMEAMWSRFLPAVRKAKEWIEEGKIGAPVYGNVRIGFCAPKDPKNRYFSPKLGGGAAFDLTVYCYEILTWLLDIPVEVLHADAVFGETGVDVTDHVVLHFSGQMQKKQMPGHFDVLAACESSFLTNLDDKLVIYGSEGKMVLPVPHFASEAFLYNNRGICLEHYIDETTENGFVYEIQEMMRCVREGKTESETVPHSLTLECAEMFDRLYENNHS